MALFSKVLLSELKSGFRIDSEFYRPDYLILEAELKEFNCKKISQFAKVTDGEHGSVILQKEGIKYLTAENVKNGYIDISKVRYVDEMVDFRNRRASVRVGDVLISIKGTLGEVAIAENWLLPANMNRDVAIIKPYQDSVILPEYLTIFLMTKFGVFQAQREGSGGVQQMITLGRLREFLIPEIPIQEQEEIKFLYQKSLDKHKESQTLYQQATDLLEQELGLDKVTFDKPISYKVNFRDIVNSSRFDSEFFNPYYSKLYGTIKASVTKNEWNIKKVGLIATDFRYGTSSKLKYISNGIPFLRIADLVNNRFEENSLKRISPIQAKKEYFASVQKGDILISRSGSLGLTIPIDENLKGAIYGSYFIKLKLDNAVCLPEYFALFMDTLAGKFQVKKLNSGGIQTNLTIPMIKSILVAYPNIERQKELIKPYLESYALKKQSKILLTQAKARVEQLIEEAAAKNS